MSRDSTHDVFDLFYLYRGGIVFPEKPTENKRESYKSEVTSFIIENIKKSSIKKIREYLLSNEDKFSADYVNLAQEIFDIYDDNPKIMMIIADSLWRMSFQLDKEIQFINMLINIQQALT